METVTIDVAKTTLSQLLARVEAGEEIVLARGKAPIARLAPFQPRPAKRRFGALRGGVSVGPEFFEPLPSGKWRHGRKVTLMRRPDARES